MEVIRGLINIKDHHKGSVVTVGNFDGVQTGHKKILDQMKVDEARHAEMAHHAGARDLPEPVQKAMGAMAGFMKALAYRV